MEQKEMLYLENKIREYEDAMEKQTNETTAGILSIKAMALWRFQQDILNGKHEE